MRRQQRTKVMKDMKNLFKKKRTPRIVGGLRICWQQTARRRGSIKKKKKICKNDILGWRN